MATKPAAESVVMWDRVREIRDHLLSLSHKEFDMTEWGDWDETGYMFITCDTPACLAGHICSYYQTHIEAYNDTVSSVARKTLGLNLAQAEQLFVPGLLGTDQWRVVRQVTPHDAAEVLTAFLETGEIDWKPIIAKYYTPPDGE